MESRTTYQEGTKLEETPEEIELWGSHYWRDEKGNCYVYEPSKQKKIEKAVKRKLSKMRYIWAYDAYKRITKKT
jgi:hypothetical protein